MNNGNTRLSITFEWNSLIRDVVRNIWAIVLAGIIAFMGIYVVEQSLYTPSYKSSTVLVVRSKVGTSGAYSSLSAASEMATIFTNVFEQPSMKTLAAENIGLESFKGSISAEVDGSTNLMTLSVEADNPELAYRLLMSVLEVYPNISESVFTDAVIDILSTPQMASAPSNSVLTTYRNHIVLLAMMLEFGLIVVLSLLRETVKDERAFSDKIDSKLIGTVSHEKEHLSPQEKMARKKRALLINDAYASLRFSEDYQKIATKLSYMRRNGGKAAFAVTSVAENEGKSTMAANIAIALSERGYKVALLDLDIRKPSLYKIFDFNEEVESEFTDVLMGKTPLNKFSVFRYRKGNLIIAFNKKSHHSKDLFNGQIFEKCIAALKAKTDFIIIDTPPLSVSADAATISSFTDGTLLAIRTDTVAVADINDAILTIADTKGHLEGCILNDVYKPFSLFGQMGTDEGGYYSYSGYSNYKKYSRSSYSKPNYNDSMSSDDSFKLNP